MDGYQKNTGRDLFRRLEALAASLPTDSAAVTLTRADLKDLLGQNDDAAEDTEETAPVADYTVQDVAEALDRSPSTVRGWLSDGVLRGYKLRGREWRVPRAAFQEFQEAEAAGDASRRREGRPEEEEVDLGAWRRHYRGEHSE